VTRAKRLRVLSLSTLFPAPPRPGFGKFVEYQMRSVAQRGDTDLVIVNPIGLPPWPLVQREPYRTLATCHTISHLGDAVVHHPRFRTLPLLGADRNPSRIANAVLPLIRRLHTERPFDVVDSQFFFPDGPAAKLIAADLRVPFTIKARGSDIHYWCMRPNALEQMREAADQAGGMLAVSEALRRDMIMLGFPGQNIDVHYTGLDHTRFKPAPRGEMRRAIADRFGLPVAGPLLLTPGALIGIKGQALAIKALASLPDSHLVLAGTGSDEASLRGLAQQLGLANRVHFFGQVSHDVLPGLMAAADVVVLPSEREGLANVWIEAMACGTPLVIPDIGGAREVVCTNASGRIAPRSPAGIASAIRDLLDALPDQAIVAASAARFSWETNAAELVAFWTRVAGR
jgi:glycosyltransferase involved in cell wall biosynthesis